MMYTLFNRHHRGFALLIAIVLTSVVLALGVALLDIAYKQVLLSSSTKNSQYAFYNADSALECALYYDQKVGAFLYNTTYSGSVQCAGMAVNPIAIQTLTQRTTVFDVPCPTGGTSAQVTVIKTPANATSIYANGYSSCDVSNPSRIERGLKSQY